jgi:hypothetical protein
MLSFPSNNKKGGKEEKSIAIIEFNFRCLKNRNSTKNMERNINESEN